MKRLLMAHDLTRRSAKALERALMLCRQTGAELHVVHVVDSELVPPISERACTEAEAEMERELAAIPAAEGVKVRAEARLGHKVADVLAAAANDSAELLVIGVPRKPPFKDLFVGSTADQLVRLSRQPVLVVHDAPAGPYQRPLAAVDCSEDALRAVEYARSLLPELPLDLLHVYQMSYVGLANLDATDDAGREQEVRNLLDDQELEALAKIAAAAGQPKVRLRPGSVVDLIPEEVRRQQADLLVMGTQGRGGVARALLGSVASEMLREPPCDVLVVPRPQQH